MTAINKSKAEIRLATINMTYHKKQMEYFEEVIKVHKDYIKEAEKELTKQVKK